jgi:hypothetical protein
MVWNCSEGEGREAGTREEQAYRDGRAPARAALRCCRFLWSLRGDSHRELLETGVEVAEPGQPKRLGTDAFTASVLLECVLAELSL